MPKIRAAPSKRVSSRKRHKIERKKREHKRDLRRAAKELKKKGLGPSRTKKARELAKLALKVSNVHPDKEAILTRVLKAREDARVMKRERRKLDNGDQNEPNVTVDIPKPNSHSQFLFIPALRSNDFKFQFLRSLSSLVFPSGSINNPGYDSFEIPSAAYLVTLDSRFAVQSVPWTLIDSIVAAANLYVGGRKVLLLFVLTKIDLVSSEAIVTQICLLASSLKARYPQGFSKDLIATIAPFSVRDSRSGRHLLRILHQFRHSERCCTKKIRSNLDNKICAFVIGFPSTGRRSLCRALTTEGGDTALSVVPMRAAQLQITTVSSDDKKDLHIKFVFPNAKAVTLVQFPEDTQIRKELRGVSGGDIFFCSLSVVDRISEPEVIACVLFEGILDKLSLSQAFCQSLPMLPQKSTDDRGRDFALAKRFLQNLGRAVRHAKGFYVSPLFVTGSGTMGKLSSSSLTANTAFTSAQDQSRDNLLDVSFSNATPNKFVHISSLRTANYGFQKKSPKLERPDSNNILRLGSRVFLREFWQSKHVPWAVMRFPGKRPVTMQEVINSISIFNLSLCKGQKLSTSEGCKGEAYSNGIIQELSKVVRDALTFLPNAVIEMDPDSIVPPQYNLDEGDSYWKDSKQTSEEDCTLENVEGGNESE